MKSSTRIDYATLGRVVLILAMILGPSVARAQERLFPERRVKPEFKLLDQDVSINAQYFVRQTGYDELWRRYDGHLPTGKGVVVAQCENGFADPKKLPGVEIIHVPGFAGTNWDWHAGYVSQILYGPRPFDNGHCRFDRGFTPGINVVFAFSGDQFLRQVLKIESYNTRGAALPAWPDATRPVKILNISNTFGNGGEDQKIRALDYLIDATDVLACSAQPGPEMQSNASLAGNLWNSLVVGRASPGFGNAGGADYENVGNHRRRKPDIVASSFLGKDGGASSWTTPTVASAAALLIERARATENTRRGERNYVLKAILLAGAAKTGLFAPAYDESGKLKDAVMNKDIDKNKAWTWSRTSEAPLDKFFGAGNLNLDNSYRILEAGEQTRDAGPGGWILGEGVTKNQPREIRFTVLDSATEFSAALVWNRHISIAAGQPYTFTVADLRLELHDAAGKTIQWSDDPSNNVEYLWIEGGLKPGSYSLTVTSRDDKPENFGLAWRNAP